MPQIKLSLQNNKHWKCKGIREYIIQPCHLMGKEIDGQKNWVTCPGPHRTEDQNPADLGRAQCSSCPLDCATFLVYKHLPRPLMTILAGPSVSQELSPTTAPGASCLLQQQSCTLEESRKPTQRAQPTSQHLVAGSHGNMRPCPEFQPRQCESWFERTKERR